MKVVHYMLVRKLLRLLTHLSGIEIPTFIN